MTSLAKLTLLAPEVGARADASDWLEVAAEMLTAETWGAVYQTAACYLAAHLATLSPVSAAASGAGASVAGAITSETTQDRSRAYGSATAGVSPLTLGDAALARTKYGLAFLQLRGTRTAAAPFVATS